MHNFILGEKSFVFSPEAKNMTNARFFICEKMHNVYKPYI